jgi:hypothetical protein
MKVYVSLTSIAQNQTILRVTLQSLVRQTRRPDALFVYLSEEPYLMDKGFTERRLAPELLAFLRQYDWIHVRWVPNTGPYRKLLPLLEEKYDEDCLIITVDDDTEYHPALLENYVRDYEEHGCCIAYRGFTLDVVDGCVEYEKRHVPGVEKDMYNFATGKGGVVYHPRFFHARGRLIFDGVGAALAHTNDDIWFNFVRVACGIPMAILPRPYATMDLTRLDLALFTNFNAAGNTKMMHDVLGYLGITVAPKS